METLDFVDDELAVGIPAFVDGHLVVDSVLKIPQDEIVFVAPRPDECVVGWLREVPVPPSPSLSPSAESAQRSSSPGSTNVFIFSTVALPPSAGLILPMDILKHYLVVDTPAAFCPQPGSQSALLHVVVSTGSGLHQAEAFYHDVLEPLLRFFGLSPAAAVGDATTAAATPSHTTYRLHMTTSPQSVTEFAKALPPGRPATVILLSGDGGVVDLLNSVPAGPEQAETEQAEPAEQSLPAIALLPLGTGNALFHSLHKPKYAAASRAAPGTSSPGPGSGPSPFVLGLRTLLRGRPAPLPNFEATFAPGSHTVSYTTGAIDKANEESKEPGTSEEPGKPGDDKQKPGKPGDDKQKPEDNPDSLHKRPKPIHRLRGAIVASYGFHAQLVWESDTPEYRKHGDKRFGMAAGELLKISHAYAARVRMVPTTASPAASPAQSPSPSLVGHRFNYVLASMVSNLERTFTISPASRPLDGQLHLVHFGAVGRERTMEAMMAAYNDGAHVGLRWPRPEKADDDADSDSDSDPEDRGVGYDAIDELNITVYESDPRWRKMCIDGTIVEVPERGWMRVRKAAKPVLKIFVDV